MVKVTSFDPGGSHDSEEFIVEYPSVAPEDEAPNIFLAATRILPKACSLSAITLKSDPDRERLYKVFTPGTKALYEAVRHMPGVKISRSATKRTGADQDLAVRLKALVTRKVRRQ